MKRSHPKMAVLNLSDQPSALRFQEKTFEHNRLGRMLIVPCGTDTSIRESLISGWEPDKAKRFLDELDRFLVERKYMREGMGGFL